jgi:serine/threonine protein kinase
MDYKSPPPYVRNPSSSLRLFPNETLAGIHPKTCQFIQDQYLLEQEIQITHKHTLIIRARRKADGKMVAIKILQRCDNGMGRLRPNHRLEIDIMRTIKHRGHPHIVTCLDANFFPRCGIIIMEYASGGDLLTWVTTNHPVDQAGISLSDRLPLFQQVGYYFFSNKEVVPILLPTYLISS